MDEKENFNCEGRLVALDLFGCSFETLNSPGFLLTEAKKAAEIAGMTVLAITVVPFNPQGLSIALTLSTSHLCIHSSPECQYASVDVFTCGPGNPIKAAQHLIKALRPKITKMNSQRRGLMPLSKKEENHPPSTGELPCLSELRPS
jgi:spermidine synthase